MWETLTDHLEVIWGAVAACGIVILLTPAVGGMARMLGVVDEPGARRLNRRAVPRLRPADPATSVAETSSPAWRTTSATRVSVGGEIPLGRAP